MECLNKSKIRILVLSTIMVLFIAGCYSDSEEALFPSLPGACDTTAVSYSTDIAPLISDYCLQCHSTAAAPSLGGNTKLEEYSDLVSRAETVLGTIKHEPGFSAMPKGGGKLSSCSIDKYEAWNNQGKIDN